MAKNIKRPAASSFFNIPDKTDPAGSSTPPQEESSTSVPITTAASPASDLDTNADASETTFSMNLPKKSKKTKLTSLQVNEEEYKEFSKIVRELGYKNSEVINQFIRDFVRANRK